MAPANRRLPNGLLALGSAAVLAVYAAGFVRTRAAASRVEESARRRPVVPVAAKAAERDVRRESAARAELGNRAAESSTNPRDGQKKVAGRAAPQARRASALTATAPPPPPTTTASTSAPAPLPTLAAPSVPAPAAPAASSAGPTSTPAAASIPASSSPGATPVLPPAPAPAPGAAAPAPSEPEPAFYLKDGTYLGWGTSRHGDIQAQVVITNGRIASATIAQCRTRYSCDVIAQLPGQVVKRQSPDVDYVTGATQSADAFYWAVVDALNKAKQI